MIGLVCLLGSFAAACSSSGSGSTGAAQSANTLVQEGLAAGRAGNTNQAFSDYKAAAAKDPNNLYAHYDLGYIYQVRGDTADAATEYQRALLINPKFGTALYNLGVLKAPTDPASAIEYYMQDLKVEPNNASANFNLGVLLIKQGQTAQGNIYLANGLRLNPALSADVPPGITVPSTTTPTKP
jgi:tetratricopeptide (TPR) repeat protein